MEKDHLEARRLGSGHPRETRRWEGPSGGARTGQGTQGTARMGDGGEGPSEGSCADEGGYRDGVVLQHTGNNSPAAREGERRAEFHAGKRNSEPPRMAIFG